MKFLIFYGENELIEELKENIEIAKKHTGEELLILE